MAPDPQPILCLAFAAVAIIILGNLARRRQGDLHLLLAEYVDKQHEWMKKKAIATHTARMAAKRKADEEAAFMENQKATLARAEEIASDMATIEALREEAKNTAPITD